MSSTASSAWFALCDGNNFYVSCERLFQPALRGRPVGVLSNNDGCVVARSDELKALGVAMGTPAHTLRTLVRQHDITLLSSNYALYGDLSARMMTALGQFTPRLEVYSIDEAFLDLRGIGPDPLTYARQIRATVQAWTGIPVSIGLAPTKTLAKVANKLAKQQGCGVLALPDEPAQTAALADLAVEDLWGISKRWGQKLRARGITTALQLREADPVLLRQAFSVVLARLVLELRGISCLALETVNPPKKQIRASRSFGRPLTALTDIQPLLAAHVTRAAEKLRRQGSITQGLLVFLHTNPFREQDAQDRNSVYLPLPVASNDTRVLLRAAAAGLARIYQPGFRYHKTGAMLLDLLPESQRQGNLFEAEESEQAAKLMATVDAINARLGRGTVRFARQGFKLPVGALRAARKSPAYTTRWEDIPIVKASVHTSSSQSYPVQTALE